MIKSTSSCGGENETAIDEEVDKEKDRCGIVWAESAIIEMDELLVECCCVRAKCNGAGSNSYDGNNIELVLLFPLRWVAWLMQICFLWTDFVIIW